MHDVAVIDDPAAAEASLDPIRARLLAELAEPGSATTLATRVGLTRQQANYHLRALARYGLVELVEKRRKGNCTERVLQVIAAARSSAAGKPVATVGIDSEVRFASARERAAFAVEPAEAVNGLVARYHHENAPGGRDHRFVVALHPKITKEAQS